MSRYYKTQKGRGACAVSICATRSCWSWRSLHPENRGAKVWKEEGWSIKISTSQRAYKCLEVKWLYCCGEAAEQNVLSTFPWSRCLPAIIVGFSQEGWGEVSSRTPSRPGCSWLSLECLFHLKCCPVLILFKFSFWFKIKKKEYFQKHTRKEISCTFCKNQAVPTVWGEGTA